MDKKCENIERIGGGMVKICGEIAYMEAMDGKVYCEKHLAEEPPTLYTIKPLEWKKNKETKTWEAKAFHSYYDTYWEGGHCYWFDMDDYRYPCTSIEHGKELAEKHYLDKLKECLEVYSG